MSKLPNEQFYWDKGTDVLHLTPWYQNDDDAPIYIQTLYPTSPIFFIFRWALHYSLRLKQWVKIAKANAAHNQFKPGGRGAKRAREEFETVALSI